MAPQNTNTTGKRRRATTGIRRPKVAGRPSPRPDTPVEETPARGAYAPRDPQPGTRAADTAPETPAAPDAWGPQAPESDARGPQALEAPDAGGPQASESDAWGPQASAGGGRFGALRGRVRLPAPPSTRRGTAILAGVTVVLVALAVLAGVSWWTMNHTQAAQNTALVDVAETTQVSQQLGDAVRTVYSYDFTRLDQNEAAARAVITPEFGQQFDQLFGEVRNLAPQQQAVVTATISQSAVEEITGDRAVMVVFLDQQATRAAGDQQQVAAAGRLTVTGQYVDGAWKIAGVQVA
jgi:Mce-associated membrane protein